MLTEMIKWDADAEHGGETRTAAASVMRSLALDDENKKAMMAAGVRFNAQANRSS